MDFQEIIPFLPIIGMALIFVFVVVIGYLLEKKRREKLKEFSFKIGFQYIEEKNPELPHNSFPALNTGVQRKVITLLKGRRSGHKVCVFDYRYRASYGKNSSTIKRTYFLVKLNKQVLPSFTLGLETFFHKFANVFGSNNIDFESHPDFSKNYLLKGSDEDSIRKVFDKAVLNYFDTQQVQFNIESDTEHLLFFTQNKTLKPDQIPVFLDKALHIARLFDKE